MVKPNNMSLVSVVIPTYNTAQFLPEAVQSALDQQDVQIEVIVVDDGSTDATPELMHPWAAREPRLTYVRQANAGVSAALNTGIALAQGDYITFLGADDVLFPHKARIQVTVLQAQPDVGLVASGFVFMDTEGRPLGEQRLWKENPKLDDIRVWLLGGPVSTNSVLVRREWVLRVGGFNERLSNSEDKDLWLRLCYAGCKMIWEPAIVCGYRLHPRQLTRNGRNQKRGTLESLDAFFAQPHLPAHILKEQTNAYAAAYLEGAFREYESDQLDLAGESLTQALQCDPELLSRADGAAPWPRVLYVMLSWAVSPHAGSPVAYVQRFFAHLPPKAAVLLPHQTDMLTTAAVWAAADACHVNNLTRATSLLQEAWAAEATFQNRMDFVCQRLLDAVKALPTEAQMPCIQRFFDALPPAVQHWRKIRQTTLGTFQVGIGFDAYHSGRFDEAASAMWRGIRLAPAWAANRGVLSILMRGMATALGRRTQSQSTHSRA
jgi:glycosyltransferase involved in cell wall biosynthesis